MAISFTIQSISILNTAPWRDSSILLSSGDLGFLSTVSDKFTIPVNHILLFQFSDFNDLSATAYVSLLIIILFLFIIYRNHKKSASRIEELKIELHNTNEKYDDIIQNLAEGFALHEVIRDEKGKIIDYRFLLLNSAFEKITGLRKDFTVGKRVLELLPNTEQYWIDIFGKVVTTGEPVKYEKFAQEFDKYFEVVAYRSSMNRFVTIFNDISDRKKVLDELKLKE
ncbi:MAG: PAS domain S-box protein, partial [Candidatus Kapaibacterium sp.]